MPSLKDLKIRIASVKSTRKITKAMQMVAAAKLRRAQEAAEAARPYAERMEAVLGNLASGVAGEPVGAAAPRRHRPRRHPPADRRHRRARPLRRLQLVDRPPRARPRHPAARRGQDGQDPDRRQEGPRAAAPRPRPASSSATSTSARCAGSATARPRRSPTTCCTASTPASSTSHPVLQPLPVGDLPDPDRAPADPRRLRGRRPSGALYEYEPDEEAILAELLPRGVATQIFTGAARERRLRAGRADVARWTTPPATPAT